MTRDDFVFTVGYQGNRGIVDKNLKSRFRGQSPLDLFEQGLYRQAFCAALYDSQGDTPSDQMNELLAKLSIKFGRDLNPEAAKRLLGVHRIPAEIQKVLLL